MTLTSELTKNLELAAKAIIEADVLLIGAGAGMGVDSGLPDFRGKEGFWNAYPMFKGRRLSFTDCTNPKWFLRKPEQAWGFYGHRFNLYSDTTPHKGFDILKRWCSSDLISDYFIYTSNVDGHFQKAGFSDSRVVECHGSINYLQCSVCCTNEIWPAHDLDISVDEEKLIATSELPRCPDCGVVVRPNILMFDDYHWKGDRSHEQEDLFNQWMQGLGNKSLVVIEMGAGVAIPTVRYVCEAAGGQLIRINPRDSKVPKHAISLPMGAAEALTYLDELINL